MILRDVILRDAAHDDAIEWIDNVQSNINNGVRYPWVEKAEKLLGGLPDDQIKLLEKKFKGINSTDQLVDRLVEILVAAEFIDSDPSFLPDSTSGPDIFLKKTNRYIEVKNLNLSDEERELLNQLENTPMLTVSRIGPPGSFRAEDEQGYQALLKKAKDLIDKGRSQLAGRDGLLYFVYSLDFGVLHLDSLAARSTRFEQDIAIYCQQKKVQIVLKKLSDFLL